MEYNIVLVSNHVVRPFLLPIPNLLNGAQNIFRFSVQAVKASHDQPKAHNTADVNEALVVAQSLKKQYGLSDDDLLIRFIDAPLESRPRGLANLFIAGSSRAERPPRVAAVSTSFIHRHILPVDPTYRVQRNAFYHLIVCCIVGAFVELEAHDDRGCLLDFNNYTPAIWRKIDAGYTFCDDCAQLVEQHPLGDALLKICTAFKLIDTQDVRLPRSPEDTGGRAIFVSYAWGNISPNASEEDRQREEVVERLCRTLDKESWKVIRDKEELDYGDQISTFMKTLGEARLVIVVLSEKYLRSPYCMIELYTVYQNARQEREEFLHRIIPLVLKDANIGNWRGRVTYAEHWETEFKAMEQHFTRLGEEDLKLYRAMRRWHNEVGDMLAYVNDKLVPHGFDEIVKDDFASLRQMLQRHR